MLRITLSSAAKYPSEMISHVTKWVWKNLGCARIVNLNVFVIKTIITNFSFKLKQCWRRSKFKTIYIPSWLLGSKFARNANLLGIRASFSSATTPTLSSGNGGDRVWEQWTYYLVVYYYNTDSAEQWLTSVTNIDKNSYSQCNLLGSCVVLFWPAPFETDLAVRTFRFCLSLSRHFTHLWSSLLQEKRWNYKI